MPSKHAELIRAKIRALHTIEHPDFPVLKLRQLTTEEYLSVLSDITDKSDLALVVNYLEKALPKGLDPLETLIAYGGVGGPLAKRVIQLVVGEKKTEPSPDPTS